MALVVSGNSSRPAALRVDKVQDKSRSGPETRQIRLRNDKVEYVFDPASGALAQIFHIPAGRKIQFPPSSAALLRVHLGSDRQPDLTQGLVSQAGQREVSVRTWQDRDSSAIDLLWRDLRDANGNKTGVEIRQTCVLPHGSEFMRVQNHIVNRGDYLITGLQLGFEGLSIGDDPSVEVFTAPTGGMGKRWASPRTNLKKPQVYSIPPTAPGSLVCGWLDVSGANLGLGVGYLNRRGVDMIGEATFDPSGASLRWRMFRYQGGWAFMEKINGPLQVYPLRPGEEFTTDDWFLGLHSGDWHQTAAFYRREYERVFEGDFLDWKKTSPAVRNADLILNSTAAWGVMGPDKKKHDLSKGVVKAHFAEIPDRVRKIVSEIRVRPANVLLVMLGQATHWGIYKLPDYFPVSTEAGGPDAFKEMIRRLRQEVGIAGTHFYAHATFNHPQADNYVAEADTGWDANLYSNFDHLGRIACTDSEGWWELWRDKIIPGFVEAGASGIEFDEGFGHHFICSKPEHRHGSVSVSILTAQPRGALRIFRQCRRAFGEGGYLESEGGSDVGARYFDLWEAGGKETFEIVRYTHPDKMIALFVADAEDICRAFVYGMVVLRHIDNFTPEIAAAMARFVELRRELRTKGAPGYPHGFRDDRGLSQSNPQALTKVFSDDRGITIACYSKEPATVQIAIDGRELGHPKIQVRRHSIKLDALAPQYVVFS